MSFEDLLPPGSLEGINLAVSISKSPDLGVLGLTEHHVQLALGEVARAVLVAGGRLTYGGRLDGDDNYTGFLINEVQRYGEGPDALTVALAWHQHRQLPLGDIEEVDRSLAARGHVVCLGVDGDPIKPNKNRGERPVPADETSKPEALTAMRRYVTRTTAARFILGGQIDGYQGRMPGILEEAVLTLSQNEPLYVAGGFGGAAALVVRALGLDTQEWAPPSWADRIDRADLRESLAELREVAGDGSAVGPVASGLEPDEARKLAASHRPGEIASLIALGLGRQYRDRN